MAKDLKRMLVETLKYPRYLIRNELKLEECPHDGRFARNDAQCRYCIDNEDCRWLCSFEDTAALGSRPLKHLVDALGFAIDSVSSLIEDGEHDVLCHCETCLWRRQADDLYAEARCHPELGPPPVPR